MQPGLNWVASKEAPFKANSGTGGRRRSSFTGGSANGIPTSTQHEIGALHMGK